MEPISYRSTRGIRFSRCTPALVPGSTGPRGKELVAWPTSAGPYMAQRLALLDRLLAKMPEGAPSPP